MDSSSTPTQAPGAQYVEIVLAGWGTRVLASIIDLLPAIILQSVGSSAAAGALVIRVDFGLGLLGRDVTVFEAVLHTIALAWLLFMFYLTGTRGQSVGKRIASIKVVRERDGNVIGGPLGLARYVLHFVDALPCMLGFLWPLWDSKKQTFTDKILGTMVLAPGSPQW